MNTIQGDLIKLAKKGRFDVIVHGCNCFCNMGKGIAKTIRLEFPEVFIADCETKSGDKEKLGSFTKATVLVDSAPLIVVNAYTQYDFLGPQPNVDYAAIRSVFRAIKQNFSGIRIGYPQIGAGLARGDWTLISGIIDEELAGEDHTVVIFSE